MKKNLKFDISFCASGTIRQTVELFSGVKLTAEQIQKGLKSGKYATSAQDGGSFLIVGKNFESIGRVTSIDNELEYTDYEVEDFDAK